MTGIRHDYTGLDQVSAAQTDHQQLVAGLQRTILAAAGGMVDQLAGGSGTAETTANMEAMKAKARAYAEGIANVIDSQRAANSTVREHGEIAVNQFRVL